jgi:hypothetical protein
VIEESVEEITAQEAESVVKEGGKHHNCICIGCMKTFTGGRMPLQYGAVLEKVVHNKFVNLTFIYDGCLKHVRV